MELAPGNDRELFLGPLGVSGGVVGFVLRFLLDLLTLFKYLIQKMFGKICDARQVRCEIL
jgi:hypothetical protein